MKVSCGAALRAARAFQARNSIPDPFGCDSLAVRGGLLTGARLLFQLFSPALFLTASAFAADTVQNLMKLDEQFGRDYQARGVEGWMSWFADNPVVFRPDGPIIRTKAEAMQYYRKVFPPGENALRWKALVGMISASGDLGFTYGTWSMKDRTGKYMTTWKKQKDGSWKIVADIGNPDTPPKK